MDHFFGTVPKKPGLKLLIIWAMKNKEKMSRRWRQKLHERMIEWCMEDVFKWDIRTAREGRSLFVTIKNDIVLIPLWELQLWQNLIRKANHLLYRPHCMQPCMHRLHMELHLNYLQHDGLLCISHLQKLCGTQVSTTNLQHFALFYSHFIPDPSKLVQPEYRGSARIKSCHFSEIWLGHSTCTVYF